MARRKGETNWHSDADNDAHSAPVVDSCGTCGGTGELVRTRQDTTTSDGHGTETTKCTACNGSGRR